MPASINLKRTLALAEPEKNDRDVAFDLLHTAQARAAATYDALTELNRKVVNVNISVPIELRDNLQGRDGLIASARRLKEGLDEARGRLRGGYAYNHEGEQERVVPPVSNETSVLQPPHPADAGV
jgi:hypothetical protein